MQTGPDLGEDLATTATTRERVRALLSIGLSPAFLATATGTSPSTIRNWSNGGTQPRPEAKLALDDIRAVAATLLDAGLEPERVAEWLTSRDARFEGLRPIEMVVRDPMSVLIAARRVAITAARHT
jgi:hypothetical protein